MRSTIVKLLTAALAAALLLSVASCKRSENKNSIKSRSGMRIAEDTPWYKATVFDIDLGIDKTRKLESINTYYIGSDDKHVFLRSNVWYKHPGTEFLEDGDILDNIIVLDRQTGKTEKIIDCNKYFGKYDGFCNVFYRKGVLDAVISTYNKEEQKLRFKAVKIDPESEKIVEEHETTQKYEQRELLDIGDYTLEFLTEYDEDFHMSYSIEITSPDGKKKEIPYNTENSDFYFTSYYVALSKTKVMLPTNIFGENHCFILDLESGKLSKEPAKDYSWLNLGSASGAIIGSDINTYIYKGTGIWKTDMDKKTVDEVFNYSWCDADFTKLSFSSIVDVNEDSFLFWGDILSTTYGYLDDDSVMPEYYMVSLEKTDSNPHAGKQVLEVYAPYGWTNSVIYNQIVKFNDTNGKYFIEIADRYAQETESTIGNYESEEDYNKTVLDFDNELGNKLSMDILNGNGPDIFLNADYFGPLNYKEHLVDLTPYIGTLDEDKYFTNIVDLAKQDGRIYNMPLCFGLDGLQTAPSNAGSTGIGFTTAEYENFLRGTLNGEDPVDVGQPYYFRTLFYRMKDKFIVNGKADFTCEDFAALARYVKDNVTQLNIPFDFDSASEEDDQYTIDVINGTYKTMKPAYWTGYSNYFYYFESLEKMNCETTLLGLPSTDGRGPSAYMSTSIAVSSHSCGVEACCEFVKSLLADDVQYEFAKDGDFAINREAFRKEGLAAADYFNTVSINSNYTAGDTKPKNRLTFTAAHIDALENVILTCSGMYSNDPDIERILVEEMPAYFTGQKSLDEVVKIAQDRVQKVLDERG